MNRLSKWFGKIRGKRLCHYCKDTWLSGFYTNGNCMNCPKCRTTYVYGWRALPWPRKVDHTISQGDPDKLTTVQIYFHTLRNGKRNECIVVHDLIDKQTQIIMEFGKWSFSNPTFTFPLMKDKITPFNVKDKVNTIVAFT